MTTTMQSRFDRFDASIKERSDDPNRPGAITTVYERDFALHGNMAQLRGESPAELGARFRAAYVAIFYTAKTGVADIEPVFAALNARNAATALHYQQLFESLVRTRQLEKARALQSTAEPLSIEWETLPEERDHSAGIAERRYWDVADDKLQLDRYHWPESSGPLVVVVAHPLCHFSRDASAAIAADPQLTALFANRSLWLAPQDGNLDLEVVQSWNQRHRLFRQRIVYVERDWPDINDWATPNFYFFRDGKLVQTVSGWPKEGRRGELLAAAKASGIDLTTGQISTE